MSTEQPTNKKLDAGTGGSIEALLGELLDRITNGHKQSIGSIDNVRMVQFGVDEIARYRERLAALLTRRDQPEHDGLSCAEVERDLDIAISERDELRKQLDAIQQAATRRDQLHDDTAREIQQRLDANRDQSRWQYETDLRYLLAEHRRLAGDYNYARGELASITDLVGNRQEVGTYQQVDGKLTELQEQLQIALTRRDHPESGSQGVQLISVERQRQISVEGWTAEHDDAHVHGELCGAAMAYLANRNVTTTDEPPLGWPWERAWWKPSKYPVKNLMKAGALIAAEIDRLLRSTSETVTLPEVTRRDAPQESPVDTYTPILWVSMSDDQKYAEYIRLRKLVGRDAAPAKEPERQLLDLEAPCQWCGYDGEGYWQAKTHGPMCPFRFMGGRAEREALARDYPTELRESRRAAAPPVAAKEPR